MEKTQFEINEWEKQNFDSISGWEKDFENQQITFIMSDKTRITFKIKKYGEENMARISV